MSETFIFLVTKLEVISAERTFILNLLVNDYKPVVKLKFLLQVGSLKQLFCIRILRLDSVLLRSSFLSINLLINLIKNELKRNKFWKKMECLSRSEIFCLKGQAPADWRFCLFVEKVFKGFLLSSSAKAKRPSFPDGKLLCLLEYKDERAIHVRAKSSILLY